MSTREVSASGVVTAPVTRKSSPWPAFLLRRAGSFLLSMWIIVTVVFFMSRTLSGDAVLASAGLDASPEFVAARRAELGLDRPVLVQYGDFLWHLVRLDFGESIVLNASPMSIIGARFPATLQLALLSFVLAVVVAVPLGMAVAARADRRGAGNSSWFHAITGLVGSIPDFVIAVALIATLAITLRLLPPAGASSADAVVLPVLTVAIGLTATLSRIVATESSRVLKEEYIRTARSMRITTSRLYLKHVLPNVVTATVTYAGLVLAALLGGTIITETVFAWPGIGSLTISSIRQLDYPMLEAVSFVIAAMALLITFLVDVVVALVDTRSLLVRS